MSKSAKTAPILSTLSIRLSYRPLRIGWCVEAEDFKGFRQSARRSFSLWGGRFNPIIPVNNPEYARKLIDLFRVDCLYPASDTETVKAFIEHQSHLPWPDYFGDLVINQGQGRKASAIADLLAPLRQVFDERFKNDLQVDPLLILHDWSDDDPLKDVLLATFGGLPQIEETAEDYRALLQLRLRAESHDIALDQPIMLPDVGQMSLAMFNSAGLRQHHPVTYSWRNPGFYVGDVAQFEDLVAFWNLRATGTPLQFYDPVHAERLDYVKKQWLQRIPQMLDPGKRQRTAIWSRNGHRPEELSTFGENFTFCQVGPELWNGLNMKPPTMYFGSDEVLASVDNIAEPPSISFEIPNSPMKYFGGYLSQRYVISVEPGIDLFKNSRFTLHLPFIPEMNEFYGCETIAWNKARAEPGSLGIIADGSTNHLSVRAIDVSQLFKAIFAVFGIAATPSAAGLVCNRLILQMGGIDGCRVFQIGGVRDLIERYSPDQSFTTSAAKQIIRAHDTEHPLSDYQDLYIEKRNFSSKLTNDAILEYLLRKEIFRPGLKLICPNCQLEFWRLLDEIRTKVECEYCGHLFHIGPQLRDRDWAYRRSGLFGRNDNQEGAISVVLTLLQLKNIHNFMNNSPPLTETATSLAPNGANIKKCETDFIFLTTRSRDNRIQLAIGECKTRKPINEEDVQNLLRIAKSFPADRFDLFIIFSKLSEFCEEELKILSSVNDEFFRRIVILTRRELESWGAYERTAKYFDVDPLVFDLEGMANTTHQIFFEKKRRNPS